MFILMIPTIWVIALLICLFVLIWARKRRPAENISLWLTAIMICLIGLQASIAYQQFQASQRPNVGIELKGINFARAGTEFRNVTNVDGNILSKHLSPIVSVKNYGEKPAFIENISIEFTAGGETLILTEPGWHNLPIFTGQEMTLRFDRPISVDDFNRIGFNRRDILVILQLTYKPMFHGGYRNIVEIRFKYNANEEKIDIVGSKYKENKIQVPEIFGKTSTALEWVCKNIDLLLNVLGALLIAFAFGKNLEGAYQTRKNWITKKERRVYLASFLHPLYFKVGCALLILGFLISLWAKQ
jgi:hypothetical protein